jgi:hypothetical protein
VAVRADDFIEQRPAIDDLEPEGRLGDRTVILVGAIGSDRFPMIPAHLEKCLSDTAVQYGDVLATGFDGFRADAPQ